MSNQQSNMDLTILPFKYSHIFLKILSYLPLGSLYTVFDVCKHWEASFDENAKFIWKKIKEIRMQWCLFNKEFQVIFQQISPDEHLDFVKIMLKFHSYYPIGYENSMKIKPWGKPRGFPGHRFHFMPLIYGEITRLQFFFPYLPEKVRLRNN